MNIEKKLEAENISKSYLTNKKVKLEVLKSISLEIEKNKITVIVGASGAGKSTLLHILAGLDTPDTGKVFYDDKNIFEFDEKKLSSFRNENIGLVFQFHHLLPEFTAEENIFIPNLIKGIHISKARNKAKELLNLVGLFDRYSHKPAELSGGEQQRIAIARALANNPDIIFADEPTGNLDTANSDAIDKIFIELRDIYKKTLVMVTHNRELVALADKVFEMKDGKLL
ncbi:MAG: lipoprotein-releasing system ATP-binding protein LolD [Ignavibacteriales bacterium CG_4_9_14_3_um_filter_30_11]|nr:MAG: lipoprotein-releasing system ATP-binding protein LolD [Ignavibacteriales bacterium CG_4_9_14_3_um_filter_30_11]